MSGTLRISDCDRRSYYAILSLSWILGFILGLSILFLIMKPIGEYHQLRDISSPSFFGVIISSVAPVLLVSVFILFDCNLFLIITVFMKALIHGFCMSAVIFSFEGSGTAACAAYMFSQSCGCFLMMFACFRLSNIDDMYRPACAGVIAFAAFVICLIDYFWITF